MACPLAQPSTFTKTGELFAEFEAQIDNTREGAALSSVVVGSAAVGLIRASRKRGRYGTQIAEGAACI